MASWRSTASAQTQADLDGLLNDVLPFAQQQLAKRGAFFPFGATVLAEGEVRLKAADPVSRARPDPGQLLEALYEGAGSELDQLRAVAFAADVKVGRGDAVRVELEHREGVSLMVVVPYTRSRENGSVRYGRLRADAVPRRFWTTNSSASTGTASGE
jgi:hypothetical protein